MTIAQKIKKANHFPQLEKLTNILLDRTQNTDDSFFKTIACYHLTKLASMMRVSLNTLDRGNIPINMYAINCGESGLGKGFSTNIIEEQVINIFIKNFLEYTYPHISEKSLQNLANTKATKNNSDPNEELELLTKEFRMLGKYPLTFDSGSSPAIKQVRHMLLMADIGSVNLEIDEISCNLLANTEALTVFLELFDQGKVKQKLTKNTNDNQRSEEILGKTPTNTLLFGSPVKLLDGGKVEQELRSMLSIGYARRCFFGYSELNVTKQELTPEQIFDKLTDNTTDTWLNDFSKYLGNLADPINYKREITVPKKLSILLIEYKQWCELRASKIPDFDETSKAELVHRYFKALKIAGAFAFIDNKFELEELHILAALKYAEESGEAFKKLLATESNYSKLAKYIASVGSELTQADLIEKLPFYKGSEAAKRDMMTLAIAYGYKNNILIKKSYVEGIEFIQGESLNETNLDKIKISYSTQLADGYKNEEVKFTDLYKLTQASGYNWCSHHFRDKD